MKYSKFELIVMVVALCAVTATTVSITAQENILADVVGQIMILVALFGGLHYGRKGALICFLISAGVCAAVTFPLYPEIATARDVFLVRSLIYALAAIGGGELNVRLKYFFTKLEHHDYVDNITSLYNAKYLGKLLEKYISEYERYGSVFCLTNFKIKEELFEPLKKSARNKFVKEIGNSVVRGNIRGSDEAARLGSFDFAVIFANTPYDGAVLATRRIEGDIKSYLDHNGFDVQDENVVKTKTLEWPKDKDELESLAANLQSGASVEI